MCSSTVWALMQAWHALGSRCVATQLSRSAPRQRTPEAGGAGTGGGVLLSVRDRAWAFSSGLPKPLVGLLCAEPGPVKEGFRPDENWDDMGLLLGCILSPAV